MICLVKINLYTAQSLSYANFALAKTQIGDIRAILQIAGSVVPAVTQLSAVSWKHEREAHWMADELIEAQERRLEKDKAGIGSKASSAPVSWGGVLRTR
jgi:hypothetical protein